MIRTKLSIVFIFLASSACLFVCHAADWPTFRGNPERTGFYPDPAGCPAGAAAWTLSLGCEIISSPSIKDNVLYIGGRDSCIYAIDCGTGKTRWKVRTGGWVDASPLVDKDRLIVGSRDSTIYVLDKTNGEILGRWTAGLQLSSPAITAGGIVLSGRGLPKGGISGYVSTSNRWDLAEPQWSIPFPQYTYSSPAIHGQAAVIGATDGKLYGIDTYNKDTIWSLQTGGIIYLSTPAIDDTTVYFAPGDNDYNVYAVNLLTGAIIWKSGDSSLSVNPPAPLAKKQSIRLLSVNDRTRLLRLSPADRKKAIAGFRRAGMELPRIRITDVKGLGKKSAGLQNEFIPLQGIKTSSVAVGTNNVFVIQKELGYVLGSDSLVVDKQKFTLRAFDKTTGEPAWSFSQWLASSRLGYCSSPVVTQNMVFFGWGEGRIYGLNAQSGEKVWEESLHGHILSSPAIAMGKLFAATMDGYVYAFDLSNTAPGLDFDKSTFCYPNPARNGVSHIQVYVTAKAELDVVVYNSVEKPVFRVNTALAADKKYAYDWDLRNVANGVYFAIVKVRYEDGKKDQKILKIAVLR
jgi:outer membrane protein assembly factor BamB